MKVYIAAPLYSQGEKDFNLKIDTLIRSWGYDTFLPQRDGGIVALMPDIVEGMPKEEYVFKTDIKNMADSDVFLFLLDGRVPDEGACVALGNSYANHKHCVGYKTDIRSLCGDDNLMIKMALEKICTSESELKEYLDKIKKLG